MRPRTALFALVAVGALLRLTGLGVHSLWYDEGCTVYLATAKDTLEALRADRHPPLAFLLFKAWIALFGEGDRAMRALSALASTAALALFVPLARAWAGARGAIAAVALYALSPFHVWHGQEVRMYGLLDLAAVAALAAAAAYLEKPRPILLVAVALSVAFAFGVQYMGALVFASIAGVGLAALYVRKIDARRLAALLGAGALGLLAWVPWIAARLPEQMRTPWGFTARTTAADLAEFPSRQILTEMSAVPPALVPVGYALGAILTLGAVAGFVLALRARRFETTAIVVAFLAPLVATLLESLVVPATVQPKYLMAVAPCTALLVAVGLAEGIRRPIGSALATLACLGCLGVTWIHRARNLREDFRGACAELAANWKPGDAVVVVTGTPEGFSEGAVRHYLRDRPDILASVRDPASLPVTTSTIHVIHRESGYSRSQMDALLAAHPAVRTGEARFRIRYFELRS
jgi:mannosyltransferase